jgi:uncharacterized protein (DUF488 family)
MYYRRKILLALVEAFGGKLKRTECQKLVFLFCQQTGKNHYDFFPYQFGAFSFTLSYDKSRLADLGLLTNVEDFHLHEAGSHVDALRTADRTPLRNLASQFRKIRGDALIRKTYVEYPHFASRSKIVRKLLKEEEIKRVGFAWNTDVSPCLFTLGYERLTIDAYLNKLITNNVKAVVDVRNNPQSMKYGFAKKTLSHYVESAGVRYFHLPELGIPSALRQDLSTPDTYHALFAHYETHVLPKQMSAIQQLRSLLAEHGRVSLTCFEANHLFCHRHKVTDFLKQDAAFKTSVIHL